MRVEQIEVGKTYEGEGGNREVIRKWDSYVDWFSDGDMGFSSLTNFASWAVREVPHAN